MIKTNLFVSANKSNRKNLNIISSKIYQNIDPIYYYTTYYKIISYNISNVYIDLLSNDILGLFL